MGPFMSAVYRGVVRALLGGMVLLMAVVGLGWAVRERQNWIYSALGTVKFRRLGKAYMRAAGALLPWDHAGYGVRDGLMLWYNLDPTYLQSVNLFSVVWDTDEIHASIMSPGGASGEAFLAPEPGRRLQIVGRVICSQGLPFPRGFQVRITPPSYARVGLPGRKEMAASVLAPVAVDGAFAFDLLVAEDAVDRFVDSPLTVANARTGQVLHAPRVIPVWRQKPIPPVLISSPWDFPVEEQLEGQYFLEPMAIPPGGDDMLFEVARDEAGAQWQPIYLFVGCTRMLPYPPPAKWQVSVSRFGDGPHYLGRLKFRLVPVTYHPPVMVRPSPDCWQRMAADGSG